MCIQSFLFFSGMDRKPTILRSNEILAQITASVVGTHHNSTFQKFSAMLKLKARRSQTGDTGLHKFKRYVKVTMYKLFDLQCTMVNKGIIIEILDFELGAFSENLRHTMTLRKGIFGLSLQKKKF